MALTEDFKNSRIIVVVGGPGSGVGTQCEKIVEKYGFSHLSSGDLVREEVASGSERGKEMTAIMKKGDIVPPEMILGVLKDAMIKKAATSSVFLIDGYPRDVYQATEFEEEVGPVECVIYLGVTFETMIQRLLGHAKTIGRVDEDMIKKRVLRTFYASTQPVIDHYAKQKKLHKIDAEGTVDTIFSQVEAILDKK